MNGRVEKIVYPDGTAIEYHYEASNLRTITLDGKTLATFDSYTAAGAPQQIALGNGRRAAISFKDSTNNACDERDLRVCRITEYATDGTLVRDTQLSYDKSGNLRRRKELKADTTEDFEVDPLGRLTKLERHGANAALATTETFTYNNSGGITTHTKTGQQISYAYDPAQPGSHKPIFVGKERLSYDRAGYLLRAGDTEYSYDAEGRMKEAEDGVGSIHNQFDGSGTLVSRQRGLARTNFVGRLYQCSNGRCLKLIYAGAQLFAVADGSKVYFIHSNAQGSVIEVSDETGKSVAAFEYSAYGEPEGRDSKLIGHRLYVGSRYEKHVGLYQMDARMYAPRLGMFTSPDPDNSKALVPALLNPYSYALNNPVNYIDPHGEFLWFIPIIAGAIIGGIEAEVHHGDVWQGMLRGALLGGFVAAGGYAVAALDITSTATAAAIYSGAGAAGNYTAASIRRRL
jgi:RHS repeat-associated protein